MDLQHKYRNHAKGLVLMWVGQVLDLEGAGSIRPKSSLLQFFAKFALVFFKAINLVRQEYVVSQTGWLENKARLLG